MKDEMPEDFGRKRAPRRSQWFTGFLSSLIPHPSSLSPAGLFGPVGPFEAARLARRRELGSLRLLSAAMLTVAVWLLLAVVFNTGVLDVLAPAGIAAEPHRVARFAAGIGLALAALQVVIVAMTTPLLMSGVVSADRHRGRLDFLLVTDLTAREIVLGKSLPRLGEVATLLLAPVPLYAALALALGVDPWLMLLATGVAAATSFGLAGLTALASVHTAKPHTAGARVLSGWLFFCVFTMAGQLILAGPVPARLGPAGAWLREALGWLNVVNPLALAGSVARALEVGAPAGDALAELAGPYARLYLAAGLAGFLLAVWRLRPASQRLSGSSPANVAAGGRGASGKPPVWDWSVAWREVYGAGRAGRRAGAWVERLTVLAALALGVALTAAARPGDRNVLVRVAGAAAVVSLMAAAGGRAARSVASETDAGTLEPLLLTGLGSDEILRQKWLAAVLAVRWPVAGVAAYWLVAAAAGWLHPLALVPLAVAVAVHVGAAAAAGVALSVAVRPARAAALASVAYLMAAVGLPWIALVSVVSAYFSQPFFAYPEAMLFTAAFSPPAAVGTLGLSGRDVSELAGGRRADLYWLAALAHGVALGVYVALGRLLFVVARRRFRTYPEGAPKASGGPE